MNADQVLARCPGLTYRQLDFWCTKGYLRPDNNGAGTGRARWFPGDEVRVAQTMTRLVLAGIGPDVAEKVARGRSELAPGVFILVDTSGNAEQRAIDREVLLLTRRIYRSPRARRLRALRAASKAGASR